MIRRVLVGSSILALAGLACVGSTGGDLVSFSASAAGPVDAVAGRPLEFDSGRGYHVTLSRATLHVGAVYLNRTVPTSGSQETSCILPGIYVGEVLGGVDVDVLSPTPQPFPVAGDGTADHAAAAELWLTGGEIDAPDDRTRILDVAGTATRDGRTFAFEGQITIGQNRRVAESDPARPGLNPMCKQRIVSPIPVDISPTNGGALLLRIDPRGWFANVDFAQLDPVPGDPTRFAFSDTSEGQPSLNLYRGLHAAEGVYALSFTR